MAKVATTRFATIKTLFQAYFQTSSDLEVVPGREVRTILSELEMLDRSIVAEHEKYVSRAVQSSRSAIETFVRENPESELAQLLVGRTNVQSVNYMSYRDVDALERITEPHRESLMRLQSDTEAFYYRAHRLLKLLETIQTFKNIVRDQKAKGIVIVRNKLMEHADGQDSNRREWSFGLESNKGPQMRPIVFGGQPPSHVDEGYFVNRDNFLDLLHSRFKLAGSST
jgi:hypothetical protein